MNKLIEALKSLQDETIKLVDAVAENDYHKQFHPDLSPIGWHLGHCVYAERYWIKEQSLGQQADDESQKSLYVPELSAKQSRGAALPDKGELLESARISQSENRSILESITTEKPAHHLLKNDYLFHFLIQHYSQHIETMLMVLTEIQLQNTATEFTPCKSLNAKQSKREFVTIEAGDYIIGSDKRDYPYDNEHPAHTIKHDSFNIAIAPVSNAEYLGFIQAGGYAIKEFWSDAGWQWCNRVQHRQPHHWQRQNGHDWFGINHKGPFSLDEQQAVYGLNYYEAEAYATWAGGRLPHEYEWEIANKKKQLQQTASVWEWCNNTFHPYTGFTAYPYAGYSAPYFDDAHYVLKGGSANTKDPILRPSFRNYYTADKRHIFAGMRLVYP